MASLNNDYNKIAQLAHTLKGSCSNLDLYDIFEKSKSIELFAKDKIKCDYLCYISEIEEIIYFLKINNQIK